METLKPLRTLKDWQDAKRAARVNYDHSLSKVVPRKRTIRKSKKKAFLSAFSTRKTEGGSTTNLDKEIPPVSNHALLEDTQNEPHGSLCQGKERQIQIFISNSVKEALCLQLHPSTSISDLKEIIQDRLGIQQEKQHLVTRKGLELRDAVSLRDYGIQQDTNLELRLVAGLIGGTKKKHSGYKKNDGIAPTPREESKSNRASAEEGDRPPLPRDTKSAASKKASRKKASRESKNRDKSTLLPNTSLSETGDSIDAQRRKKENPSKLFFEDIEPRTHSDPPERQEETVQFTSSSPASANISKKSKGRKRKSRQAQDHDESIRRSSSAEKRDNLEQSLRFSRKDFQKSTEIRRKNQKTEEDPKTQSVYAASQDDQEQRTSRVSSAKGNISKKARGRKRGKTSPSLDEPKRKHASRQDDKIQRTSCVSSAAGDISGKARGRKRGKTSPSQDEPLRQHTSAERATKPSLSISSATGAIPKKSRKEVKCHKNNEPQDGVRTSRVSFEDQDETVQPSKPSPTAVIAHSSRRRKRKGHRLTTSEVSRTHSLFEGTQSATIRNVNKAGHTNSKPQVKCLQSSEFATVVESPITSAALESVKRVQSRTEGNDRTNPQAQDEHIDQNISDTSHGQSKSSSSSAKSHRKRRKSKTVEPQKNHSTEGNSALSFSSLPSDGVIPEKCAKKGKKGQLLCKSQQPPTKVSLADEEGDKLNSSGSSSPSAATISRKRRSKNKRRKEANKRLATANRQIESEKSLGTSSTAGDINKTRKRTRRRSHKKSARQQNQRKQSASSESQTDPTQTHCVLPGIDEIKQRQSETTNTRKNATSQPLASQCNSGEKISNEELKTSRLQSGNYVHIENLQIHGANKSPTIVGTCTRSSIQYGTDLDTGEEHNRKVADMAEKALKTLYKSRGSFVQVIPWVSDNKMHIMDIYTELELENATRNKDGTTEKIQSYEEIFRTSREGSLIKRMILTGTAGLGKSTLIDKMAYDWAMGSSKKLGLYKLVFVLKMHALEQTANFLDAVFDQLLDETSIERSALSSYINTNPDEVLILLDGFDELMTTSLHEPQFGSILKILKRREGAELSVVVTTRSSHFSKLMSNTLIEEPATQVKVLGFNEECVKQYVTKFYSQEDHEKSQGLLKRIFSSVVLSDLAKSPMLLFLLCILWREDCSLPETMSSLYNDAMRYIFMRKTDITPEEMSKLTLKIGKVALDGLLEPKQILSFPERLFESDVLSIAVSAGILTRQRVMKRLDTHNSVMFIHKTFQEYCAAKFFQYLERTAAAELQTFLDKIDKLKNNISALDYLLRFCCGDNKACTIIILQIVHKYLYWLCVDLRWLIFGCYFECQSNYIPSERLITSVIPNRLHFEWQDRDFLNTFLYFLENVSGDSNGNGNVYLPGTEEIRFCQCDLQSFDKRFADVLKRMTNIRSLKLHNCSLTASNMKYIVSSLENTDDLSELELSGNEMLSGSAEKWHLKSKVLKRLQNLDMGSCLMKGEDMKLLLCEATNLVSLSLPNNELGNSASLFGPHLQQMQQLQKLNLSGCHLRGKDAKHIVVALGSSLTDLNLSNNTELCGTAKLWAPYLKRLRRLEKLGLSSCSLTGADVAHVDASSLLELDLSQNDQLGGSAQIWSPTLKCMTELNVLELWGCNIQGRDLPYLKDLMSSLPSIQECNTSKFQTIQICENTIRLDLIQPILTGKEISIAIKAMENMNAPVEVFGSGRVSGKLETKIWAPSLTHLKNLYKLTLKGYSLKSRNIKHIAKSVCDATKLVELDLSENQTLGGDARVWGHKLKKLKHLQKVFLKKCDLKGKDMEHVLVSLGKIGSLVELDLSENDQLSGSAELWSCHLKHMTNLRTLKLTDCKFQAQDLKSLAASILEMKNLEECHTGMLDVKKTTSGTTVHLEECSSLTGKDLADLLKVMGTRSDLVALKLTDYGQCHGRFSSCKMGTLSQRA